MNSVACAHLHLPMEHMHDPAMSLSVSAAAYLTIWSTVYFTAECQCRQQIKCLLGHGILRHEQTQDPRYAVGVGTAACGTPYQFCRAGQPEQPPGVSLDWRKRKGLSQGQGQMTHPPDWPSAECAALQR